MPFQLQWLYSVQYDSFTHVVGQADQRDAVSSKKDVALPQLTALPGGLMQEQTLDTYQPGPLLARVHSTSHTEPQATTAFQQAHFGCGVCNTKHSRSGPHAKPFPLESCVPVYCSRSTRTTLSLAASGMVTILTDKTQAHVKNIPLIIYHFPLVATC